MTEAMKNKQHEPSPQEIYNALVKLGYNVQGLVVEQYGDAYDVKYVPDDQGKLITAKKAISRQQRKDRDLESD